MSDSWQPPLTLSMAGGHLYLTVHQLVLVKLVAALLNIELTELARDFIEAIVTSSTKARSEPYSTRSWPSSSRQSRLTMQLITSRVIGNLTKKYWLTPKALPMLSAALHH
jgi:hypothetical protein